jgi:hypothetical protein
MSYQNYLDAIDAVLAWEVSADLFSDAVLSQAALLAGVSPDDIGECSLE